MFIVFVGNGTVLTGNKIITNLQPRYLLIFVARFCDVTCSAVRNQNHYIEAFHYRLLGVDKFKLCLTHRPQRDSNPGFSGQSQLEI